MSFGNQNLHAINWHSASGANTPDSVFSTVEAVRVSLKVENGEEEELAVRLACPHSAGSCISCAGRWAGGLAPCGAPTASPGTAGAWGAELGMLPAAVSLILPRRSPQQGRQRVLSPQGKPTRRGAVLLHGWHVAGLSLRASLATNQTLFETHFSSGKQKKTVSLPQISHHL